MLSELFYSIEDVWAIWLISCGALSALLYRSLRVAHWRTVANFLRDEQGASYALPYMMAFPVYMLMVCFVIQSSMIIIVKIGVMHSAHMAARSAVVWRAADPQDHARGLELAEDKAQYAAVMAIAPVASGYTAHQNVFFYDLGGAQLKAAAALPKSFGYQLLYEQLAGNTEAADNLAEADYVRRKFIYASAMTDVELSDHVNAFNQSLSAEVNYRMPIHIPGAGRVMGTLHWSGKGYYRDITARAMLPLETPESPDGFLGIQYDPTRL